jgi:hypothetical protein
MNDAILVDERGLILSASKQKHNIFEKFSNSGRRCHENSTNLCYGAPAQAVTYPVGGTNAVRLHSLNV